MKRASVSLTTKTLLALFLPFTLILGGGIWGGLDQHSHRSAAQGGTIAWLPTGFVGCFAGTTTPAHMLVTDGSAVSRTTYADLYSVIGTTYGAGDGSTTFTLPDTRGRSIIHVDGAANRITAASTNGANADTLGGTGGTETHTLTIAEIPAHGSHLGAISSGYGFSGTNPRPVESVGGGGAHSVTSPWIALHCMIGT